MVSRMSELVTLGTPREDVAPIRKDPMTPSWSRVLGHFSYKGPLDKTRKGDAPTRQPMSSSYKDLE